MEIFFILYILGFSLTPILIKIWLKETWKGMWDVEAIPYILYLSVVWMISIPCILYWIFDEQKKKNR